MAVGSSSSRNGFGIQKRAHSTAPASPTPALNLSPVILSPRHRSPCSKHGLPSGAVAHNRLGVWLDHEIAVAVLPLLEVPLESQHLVDLRGPNTSVAELSFCCSPLSLEQAFQFGWRGDVEVLALEWAPT